MPLNLRPLSAILVLTLAAGGAEAAKKPATPAAATACTDFYASVNGAWQAANPLPAGADRFSRWDELNAIAERQTRELLARTDPAPGPASSLLANLVASGTDEATLDSAGKAALQPLLDRIAAIRKPKDIAAAIAALQAAGVPVLFDLHVHQDAATGQPRATLVTAALGLPEPAFYNTSEPSLQEVGRFYGAYVADLLKYSGVPGKKLAEQSGWALALEGQLARVMRAPTPTVMTVAEADKAYPQLQLPAYLQTLGVSPAQLTIEQPEFFKSAGFLIAKTPVPQWQAYLRTRVLHSLAPTLDKDYRRAYVGLVDNALAKRLPRTQADRVAELVTTQAGDLLSAAYAERYVSSADEQRALAIGESLRAAMGRAIDRSTWLSADGKAAARRQLAALRLAIGKPSDPVSFDGLRFDRGQYANNVLALRRWQKARELARLATPAWPWPVSQARPVIGFEAGENRLVVTAAALRAPVLGDSAAADYGALGALIGQQMSLGFRNFSGADAQAWSARTAPLLAQYAAYPMVDGARTLPQNVADLAGLELAWDALNAQGPVDAAGKQAFFNAWAGVWARQDRPGAAVAATGFAPPQWRVNGTVVNHPEFAKAFACKKKQPMFKPAAQQTAIWR